VLLNRKRIAEKGNLQADVVPMVRIPPNARERNQWVIKQALDTGVYGLVLPQNDRRLDLVDRIGSGGRYPWTAAEEPMVCMTLPWWRQSRANPSLKTRSLSKPRRERAYKN